MIPVGTDRYGQYRSEQSVFLRIVEIAGNLYNNNADLQSPLTLQEGRSNSTALEAPNHIMRTDNRTISKMHWLVMLPLLICTFFAASQLSAQDSGSASNTATVVTDRDDYAPFSIVYIDGAGFQAGETVSNQIVQISGPAPGTVYEPWEAVADTNGNISTSWFVFTEDLLDTTLQLTSLGESSGRMAQTTFKDASVNISFATTGLPAGASVTVNYSGINNGGNPISGSINFISPGPSSGGQGSVGVKQGSTFTYTFPATVTVNGVNYSFVSGSPASPLTAADTVTVVGQYQPACTAPTIVCPSGIVVNASSGSCLSNVTFAAAATGNPAPTITFSPQSPGSSFPVGTTTVTATAVNTCGSASCSFNVTVVDNQPPTITGCPASQTVSAGVNCQAIVPNFAGATTATDNCTAAGALTKTQSPGAGTSVDSDHRQGCG